MKKIINGKMYNTDTAKECGSWWNRCSTSDFHHRTERLFQKKTGEFFLYGEGGPMTRWAHSCGDNSWCGGEGIEPMTIDEAKEWAEKHLDADEYIEIFGEVEE